MRAVAKGFNMHGEPVLVEGTAFLARALQHETDHLNGIVFIDRLPQELRKQAMKDIRNSEWFLQSQADGIAPEIRISPHQTFGRGI
jgi:peptide deformylase